MSKLFVLTGPPGSGKTSIIEALRRRGISCVDEPARRVIAEQRRIGGTGTSEQDPQLFVELMLEMALEDYHQHKKLKSLVIFDRGIPDLLTYAKHFSMETTAIVRACETCLYHEQVLNLPAWEDIYKTDEERTMDFQATVSFGQDLENSYTAMGYSLRDIPHGSLNQRVDLICQQVVEL